VLTPADDAAGQDVIACSTQPAAQLNNGENLDLEPSYAYMGNLFGSAGANPYNEETGIVAANLNEAPAQEPRPSTSGPSRSVRTSRCCGSGTTLGFLVTAAYGTAGGTGTVVYTDGTTQEFTLTSPDWFGGSGDVAFQAAYRNRQGDTTYQGIVGVPLQAGKTTSRVRLPAGSSTATAGTPSLHVFAMARG